MPLSTFRQTSKENLISRYNLSPEMVDLVKQLITRQPISDDVLFELLSNSNYTCNVCKGLKGTSYVIHHIDEYSSSQDNRYENLIVLCPTCHDLAHRENGLTNRLDKTHLLKIKERWESQVEAHNISQLGQHSNIQEADYINIPRICDLSVELFGEIPRTSQHEFLVGESMLNEDRSLNMGFIGQTGRSYPFDFGNTHRLRWHFHEVFKAIASRIRFLDLDVLLTKTQVLDPAFIGTYCFYIGGLYGNSPSLPINDASPLCHLYFRRKYFYVEWKIDPRFMLSSTAIGRLSEHTVYLVFGRVRSVGTKIIKDKTFIQIDIRPYYVGIPNEAKTRVPVVKYIKQQEFNEEDYEDDYGPIRT